MSNVIPLRPIRRSRRSTKFMVPFRLPLAAYASSPLIRPHSHKSRSLAQAPRRDRGQAFRNGNGRIREAALRAVLSQKLALVGTINCEVLERSLTMVKSPRSQQIPPSRKLAENTLR